MDDPDKVKQAIASPEKIEQEVFGTDKVEQAATVPTRGSRLAAASFRFMSSGDQRVGSEIRCSSYDLIPTVTSFYVEPQYSLFVVASYIFDDLKPRSL